MTGVRISAADRTATGGNTVGDLAKRLDAMAVRVNSPDAMIQARIQNRNQVSFAFRPGSYERYEQAELEHQLTRLGKLLWTGYRRGYYLVLSETTGRKVTGPKESWDPHRRRYREELAATVFEGRSTEDQVRVACVGMLEWTVKVRPGALRRLDERAFVGELTSAAADLLVDHRLKTIVLKDEHYGLNIPSEMRMPKGALRREV